MATLTMYHKETDALGKSKGNWLPHKEVFKEDFIYKELSTLLTDRFIYHRSYVKKMKYTDELDGNATFEFWLKDNLKYVFRVEKT